MGHGLVLRSYQQLGRDFLASKRHALLADEMRVGKTPQAILAADKIGAKRILVVCRAIGVEQWRHEWNRWSSERTVVKFTGWIPAEGVVVISYARASINIAKLAAVKWDLVIADEAHYAKNPDSARTKLVYGKRGVGFNSRRLWALTGTPAGRHAGELWPMLRAFGVTNLDYADFLAVYCDVDQLSGRVYGTKAGQMSALRSMLAVVMLRRMRKEVQPDMPPIGYEFLEADDASGADLCVLPDQREPYLLHWIEQHAFATMQKERIEVANSKVLFLAEEITTAFEGRLLEKTVVFGHYKEPLVKLTEMLNEAGIRTAHLFGETPSAKREEIQREFRDGGLQVICANIQTAGTSIDLSAASHGYFLELDWVPANNAQAASRLVSITKKEPVTFDIVTRSGSIDDRLQRVLIRRVRQLSNLY